MSSGTLTLTISADGSSVEKDPESFHAGPPKSAVRICVVNNDPRDPHQVRMDKIKHHPSGKQFDPLTGSKRWLVPKGEPKCTDHKVKKDALVDPYDYVVILDEVELSDPEIVVDPPVDTSPHGKKKQPSGGTAKKRQTGTRASAIKRKPAKRGGKKQRSAPRAAAKKKRRSRR